MSLLGKWFGFGKDEIYDEGMAAYDRRDYESAIDAFEACLAANPDATTARLARFNLAESYAQLGFAYEAQGEHEAALDHLRLALLDLPEYPDIHLAAARACIGLGDRAGAERHVDAALASNSKYVDAILLRGTLLYERGCREAGLAEVARAFEIEPSLNAERYEFALERHVAGEYERALANLRAIAPDAGSDAELHLRIGDSFVRDRLFEEATQEYRKAVRLAPDYPDLRCRLGAALLETGELEDAILEFRRALSIHEGYAEAHAQLGVALRRLRQDGDARQAFSRALAINPNHPVAAREMALLA